MFDIPRRLDAIESRLVDHAAEIRALDAAKAELAAPSTGGQAPAITAGSHSHRRSNRG